MPTQRGDSAGHTHGLRDALDEALDEALAALPDEERGDAREPADYRWLAIGMRLGLDRPEQARHLLEMIATPEAARTAPAAGDEAGGAGSGRPSTGGPGGSTGVPAASSLLARAAAMPPSDRANMGPEVTFGWAAGLTQREIRALGQVVQEMLTAGAPQDIGRGFGLAWNDGVKLPREELDAMFREFTELEITVGGVLAGRDLRVGEPAPRRGLGALLNPLLARGLPGQAEAGAAMESSGEPGRRGLVALWNAWVAMQYRARIPAPTFELLVRPWVTVVGPLPER